MSSGTAAAGEAMAGGKPREERGCMGGRGEEGGHRRGYFWSHTEGCVQMEMWVTCLCKPEGTKQTPGCSNSTQVSQRETISSSRVKWAEGKGVGTVQEDFIPMETSRSPSQVTLSGETGRRCLEPSAYTLAQSSGACPQVDQPGAGPRASSGSGQRCHQ